MLRSRRPLVVWVIREALYLNRLQAWELKILWRAQQLLAACNTLASGYGEPCDVTSLSLSPERLQNHSFPYRRPSPSGDSVRNYYYFDEASPARARGPTRD